MNKFNKKKIRPIKTDYFSKENIKYIDYKDVNILQRFTNKTGRINSKVQNKLFLKNQKLVSKAIKRARRMALMSYTSHSKPVSFFSNYSKKEKTTTIANNTSTQDNAKTISNLE